MKSTVPVPLDLMIMHGAAVVRGSRRALVVVDMPFGSYEESPAIAFRNAARVMKETGCGAIKLEGGTRMAETIRYLTERGIPVMAHIGLTPQSVNVMGGFKTQGRRQGEWAAIEADAAAVAEAGAFAVVLEGMAELLAARITKQIPIPTIGIGASVSCDGQILVLEDMLGLNPARAQIRQEIRRTRQCHRDGREVLCGGSPRPDVSGARACLCHARRRPRRGASRNQGNPKPPASSGRRARPLRRAMRQARRSLAPLPGRVYVNAGSMRGAAIKPSGTMSDDNIFREVDEDLRREQMTALMDKYGVYVLIGAAIIIVIVGGFNVYSWWTIKRAGENGAAYYQAAQLIDEKKNPEALEAFSKFAGQASGGYHTLAELEVAALHAQQGRKAEAVAVYDRVAQSGATPRCAIMRGSRRLRCASTTPTGRRSLVGLLDLILTTMRGDIRRGSC